MSKQKIDNLRKLTALKLQEKIRQSPEFLGFYLKKYQEIEKIDFDGLLRMLQVQKEDLSKIEFYRLPENTNLVSFCENTSNDVGVKVESLLAIIKHVQAVEVLRKRSSETQE